MMVSGINFKRREEMGIDAKTYALSKKYTDDSIAGGGAIKGKNCTMDPITAIEGGHRATYRWTLDDGTEKSQSMDVMDGEKGDTGTSITEITADGNFLVITLSDGTTARVEIPTVEANALDDLSDVELSEVSDGQTLVYDAEAQKWVNAAGGTGDSSLTADVTSNLAVGAIPSGTTLPEGTTFTEFAQKLLITEIAPTTTFTASGSGVKEIGTSVTPTLTLTITNKGTGTPTAIKFYSGSTLLDAQNYVEGTNTYTHTLSEAITENTTVKGVLEYTKSDETAATIEKTAAYTFVLASYYGAVTTAPTTLADITALTKNVKNTKAQTATFNLSNQRSCYCYPSSFGNLTSIKDANNFEYLASYTKTVVGDYNVYTLTDPVTATGFKQIYA